MAISNPAALNEFWAGLRIKSAEWSLLYSGYSSRTEGGETITAARGTRLWAASVALVPMYHRQAEAIRAKIALLAGADRSFLCYPVPVYSPSHDPDGAIVAGASPILSNIASDRIQMRISGLPGGYKLVAGEFVSFSYGSSPVRYALHQLIEDVTADGAGLTPQFEVRPAIRPGATVGAAVAVYRPIMRAQIVRDSISYGTSEGATVSGIGFSFIQTLRG